MAQKETSIKKRGGEGSGSRKKDSPRKFSAIKKKNSKERTHEKELSRLQKFEGNPIIQPNEEHSWESKATFNPGAFYENGKVYLLYRAIGDNDVSVLGYASTSDGLNIDERFPYPAYANTGKSETQQSKFSQPLIFYGSGGGGNGGCEDPRLTLLDGKVYLLYAAFDGWASLRMALTSLSLDDFRNKKWDWKKPVFISPQGEIHKNWVIFPDKINGKYAILHSTSPKILVDYFDSLDDFDGDRYIENSHRGGKLQKSRWDSLVRGAGPPPIKTKDGWLLLYHAIDHRDPDRYKLGAMLLDLKNPSKALSRSKEPILEPDESYENDGFKAGVVYSCGAVVMDDTLFIYYGGADSVVCVATANLENFLKELKRSGVPKLKRAASVPKK